jgi:tetratricopeptide (TPR) repeat protein
MRKFVAGFLAFIIVFITPVVVSGQTLSYNYTRPFDLALFYFAYGRWDLVPSELNRALQENPKDAQLLAFVGSFLSALGDQNQAKDFLGEAEKVKASPGILVLQGDVYRLLNNPKKAEEYYKKALQRQPSSVMAYIGIGKLREQSNQLEEALGFYLQASTLNPNRLDTLMSIGRIQYQLNQYEEAVEQFRKAVELDPAGARTHLWYAKALLAAGNVERGLQQLERTLELDSSIDEAVVLLNQWQLEDQQSDV